jgi:5-methylcytosine-specific restriction protein A
MKGGWVDRKSIARGPGGRGLCRWCSLEVPRGRFTFCSEFCVHEWKLRTQPAYLREKVFERDRGICSSCQLDTVEAARKLRYSRGTARASLLAHWGLRARSRRTLWDADHIVPVIEGGGECDLSNIRTLCLLCHRDATSLLRNRIRRSGNS